MKILIITIAGAATRFNRNLSTPTLKCLYYKETIKNSLLYIFCNRSDHFDKIILVGGYLYSELSKVIQQDFVEFSDKIELVENKHYLDRGSMYSLYLGMERASRYKCSEVSFIEGDLYFSLEFYNEFCQTTKDIITVNREPIISNKSVILYIDTGNKVHYVYDTAHHLLNVPVAFQAVYNSAQAWKFVDCDRLFFLNKTLTAEECLGTNLVLVQKYFETFVWCDICFLTADTWFNCNTVDDYSKIYIYMKGSCN